MMGFVLANSLFPQGVGSSLFYFRGARQSWDTDGSLFVTRSWGIECPLHAVTIYSCKTEKCRGLTEAGRIWREKVLLENISPEKDLVTRFACGSPYVVVDDILCDFCFDSFLPGFVRLFRKDQRESSQAGRPGSSCPRFVATHARVRCLAKTCCPLPSRPEALNRQLNISKPQLFSFFYLRNGNADSNTCLPRFCDGCSR